MTRFCLRLSSALTASFRYCLALVFRIFLLLSLSWTSGVSPLVPSQASEVDCPDSQLLSSKLITDICWDCMLPIKIAGIALGEQQADIPQGAVSQPACLCQQVADLPRIGYTLGFWQPQRVIELSRSPGCLLTFNGNKVKIGREGQYGKVTGELDLAQGAFLHYHYYAFPLLQILELFNQDFCVNEPYASIDLLYLSEIDPAWNYPEIASLIYPETALFANEASVLACAADTIASLAMTSPRLPWCAGSWGTVYPLTGFTNGVGSGARISSLLGTRALAISHRRGFENQTLGHKALCKLEKSFNFVPEQYRFSMLYPLAQGSKHPVGKSTFLWGESSNAQDAIYLVWRWRDCCSSLMP